jgi:hypothetical protein
MGTGIFARAVGANTEAASKFGTAAGALAKSHLLLNINPVPHSREREAATQRDHP